MMSDSTRPLDLTWDDPLPHALTPVLTYLSPPSASTSAAIIAVHGRGDNARDFAEAIVPHLRTFFGAHLVGDVTETCSIASEVPAKDQIQITLRALEARDGIWFGTHTRRTAKSRSDLDFQAPYVHSSLAKLRDEIESLNSVGIPNSRIVLVGFSQGAILVNAYVLRALHLLSRGPADLGLKVEVGDLKGSPLPLPANILAWAGTTFNFDPTFPQPGWPSFSTPPSTTVASSDSAGQRPPQQISKERGVYEVYSHQQCGSSDRYFSGSEIETVAKQISDAGLEATKRDAAVVVRASAEMEAGVHSILPGMIGRLIEMVQRASRSC